MWHSLLFCPKNVQKPRKTASAWRLLEHRKQRSRTSRTNQEHRFEHDPHSRLAGTWTALVLKLPHKMLPLPLLLSMASAQLGIYVPSRFLIGRLVPRRCPNFEEVRGYVDEILTYEFNSLRGERLHTLHFVPIQYHQSRYQLCGVYRVTSFIIFGQEHQPFELRYESSFQGHQSDTWLICYSSTQAGVVPYMQGLWRTTYKPFFAAVVSKAQPTGCNYYQLYAIIGRNLCRGGFFTVSRCLSSHNISGFTKFFGEPRTRPQK